MDGENGALTNDDRTWGMLCHLAALSAFIGVPFGSILGPLVIWLVKKDGSAFVDHNGKEALNFQISMTIYAIISGILILVFIGIIMLIVVAIADIALTIMAAVKANNGEHYQYPMTIRFIK